MTDTLQRLCQIEIELSDLHEANKHGSFDMDGNKRRNLSEEHVFLSRQLDREKHGDRAECLYTVPDVCSARWTQDDWDRRCQNPNHK